MKSLLPLTHADLIESENDYHVVVDMPGVEDLNVNIDNNYLDISAEKKKLTTTDTDIYHTTERSFGKVRRRLLLPTNINADQVQATYKDGVLRVVIPKAEGKGTKKIDIQA